MPRYLGFLRAVNVGGRFVKMEALRAALQANGFDPVETHIQSGNVLVGSRLRSVAAVEASMGRVLTATAGFTVVAIVRTPAQLRDALAAVDGVPEGEGSPRRYLMLCQQPVPAAAAAELEAWDRPDERAVVLGSDVLLELRIPASEVKLTNARAERMTGTPMTTRDLKVIRTIVEKWSG